MLLLLVLLTALAHAEIGTGKLRGEIAEWPLCELGGTYSLPHNLYCDRYFTCQHGQSYLGQCEDGLGFVPFKGCKLLHLVDCVGRSKLQSSKGQSDCLHLYGVFPNPHDCASFLQCDNGTAAIMNCPPRLVFDSMESVCRAPTPLETTTCLPPIENQPPESSKGQADCPHPYGVFPNPHDCASFLQCDNGTAAIMNCPPRLVFDSMERVCRAPTPLETTTCLPPIENQPPDFKCPSDNPFLFGDHSRHPYPGNCSLFIMCLRDGSLKVGSCEPGTAYSALTYNCELASSVSGCSTAH